METWLGAPSTSSDPVCIEAAANVMFILAPPLQYTPGNAPGKEVVEEWFATWRGPLGYEIRNLSITTDALTLEELPDGTTQIATRITFDSLQDLHGMLQSGMEDGAVASWDRLEELVTKS
jgi:hypothetical protein